MAGKDVAAAVAATSQTSVARRLWRVVRAVLYMMRRGVPSGRKLAMDLHLFLHRSKIAGKALGGLVNFHNHGRHQHAASFSSSSRSSPFSCRALDPALAVHEPSRGRREVEFSCSNTPASAATGGGLLGAAKRRRRNRHHRGDDETGAATTGYYNYDAADIAMVFEMLNDSGHLFDDDALAAVVATPSPALWTPASAFARSPAVAARQLRITDSPFAASDDGGAAGEQQVDRKADEFIRRFYEQLRAQQQSVAATPDYYGYAAASSSYNGHAPRRPVAAGIA